MSTPPSGNKPSDIKTPTPVENENARRESKNGSPNPEKSGKDSGKSDMKSGKSDKGRS